MKQKKEMTEREKIKKENNIMLVATVLITSVIITTVIIAAIKAQTPTAKELLDSVSIPEIPMQLNRGVIDGFLADEKSITVDAHIDFDYEYTNNQTTWTYNIKNPVVGTLDVCSLKDGRSVVSIGGTMENTISSPFMQDRTEHTEKNYFLILNDGLNDADIFMRKNNYTVSINDAGEEIVTGENGEADPQGEWQFVNDKGMDIDGLIELYNADNPVSANSISFTQSLTELKDNLARGAKVTKGSFEGTECYVLTNRIDFSDKKTRQIAKDLFLHLESSNDVFYNWNLSQFLDYYGDYTVINVSMYFLDLGNGNYQLFVTRLDLSECRVMEHIADRFGFDMKVLQQNMVLNINEMYVDFICFPVVPDEIRQNMEALEIYANSRLNDIQEGNYEGN